MVKVLATEISMQQILNDTYQKFGYKMFDCTAQQFLQNADQNNYYKKNKFTNENQFKFVTFKTVEEAIGKINCVYIPEQHGKLPKTVWSLQQSNTLLLKEIWFYNYNDRYLYQCAVERAWALGSHSDPRVKQINYD